MAHKILVIEDLSDSREILVLQLRRMGYEVVEAESATTGIEKALAESPDLIIMDLGLAGMDGIQAALRLKENSKTASIPVIAYTVWDREVYQDKAEKTGIAAYLTKPTPPHVFKAVIEKLLRAKP